MRSSDGVVYLPPIEQALSRMDAVDQVVAYGVGESENGLAVAAITLRDDARADSLTVTQLRVAFGALPAESRPHLIHIVDDIPVSDSYRPLSNELRRAGVPRPGPKVWYRDDDGRYRRYTRSAAAKGPWEHRGDDRAADEVSATAGA